MFSSFRLRDFRIYWIGMLVSLCGTWMQSMAQNWLVFDLTKSSMLLGLVGFMNYAPFLFFSLFFGVLVDRVNKRKLLIFTQCMFMVLALSLAVLTHSKLITVEIIFMISLLHGIVLSLDAPARHTMIFDIVGKKKILNAIALNSIAFHGARMIGPALAGILVATITIAGCFYINTISFLALIVALLLIQPKHATSKNNSSYFIDDLKDGVRFLNENRLYLFLISIVGMLTLFGFSYIILMPVYAKEVLRLGVRGYGVLISASGVGSLLGALMLAKIKNPHAQSKALIFSLCIFSMALILFSISKVLTLSIFALIIIGFCSLSAAAIINSMIQSMVPDEFRGRVMSVYMMVFAGAIPFGSLLSGGLAQVFGVSSALGSLGAVCLGLSLFFSRKLLSKSLVFA